MPEGGAHRTIAEAQGDMIDVSVIVVNLNTRALLAECLASVLHSKGEKEVIVVDNGSVDGSAEMVERDFPHVQLIRNKTNERFAKPNNDAMKSAQGRYVLLLNSDASLKDSALEKLVTYMDAHSDVGMCGPQLLYPDGRVQPSCRGFVSLWSHACDMLLLDRLFRRSRFFARSEMTFFDHLSEREVDHVMAAAVLVRMSAVQRVGMFDESFSIYYNDLDWSYRMKRAGWRIVFYPEAQVVHHLGRTARPMIRDLEIFREQHDNILYFYEKHFGRHTAILYKGLLIVGFAPRALFWLGRLLVDRSDHVRAHTEFSIRTFLYGLSFWKSSKSRPDQNV